MVSSSICLMEMGPCSLAVCRPAILSNGFLDLCQARNRVGALTIVYWAVLLDRNTHAWWWRGWLLRLIRACEQLFAPTPELIKWLEWPIEMSKHQPDRLVSLSSTRASPMELTPAAGTTPIDTPPANLRDIVEAFQGPIQS